MRELLKWKEYSAYGVRYAGYLGKWRLCTIAYNHRDRGKGEYILSLSLPGMAERTYCDTVESAKDTAIKLVTCWLISAVGNVDFRNFLQERYNISPYCI